jgi:hypothetical protein
MLRGAVVLVILDMRPCDVLLSTSNMQPRFVHRWFFQSRSRHVPIPAMSKANFAWGSFVVVSPNVLSFVLCLGQCQRRLELVFPAVAGADVVVVSVTVMTSLC